MTEHSPLLPLAQKYFEQDIVGATHSLEMMDEMEAIEVLKVFTRTSHRTRHKAFTSKLCC